MKKTLWFGCLCFSLACSPALLARPPQPVGVMRLAIGSQIHFDVVVDLANMLLQLGNFRQLDQLIVALQPAYNEQVQSGNIAPQDAHRLDLLLAKTRLLEGQHLLARQQGDQLVEWSQADPETLLETYACLLLAGQKGGLPDVTNKYLAPYQAAADKIAADKAPFWRYLGGSFAEFQALQKEPNITTDEFCRRHDAVWQTLDQSKQVMTRPLAARVSAEVSRLWLENICATYAEHAIKEDSPEDKRVGVSVELEFKILAQRSQMKPPPGPNQLMESLPDQFHLFSYLSELHTQGLSLHLKDIKEMLTILQQAEAVLRPLDKEMLQAEKDIDKAMTPEFRAYLPKGFQFSITSGDWWLTRMRIRLAELQQLLNDNPGKLNANQMKTARRLALESCQLNARALPGAGYQGTNDPRWTVIEMLLAQKPPGWQKESEDLLGSLRETNQRLGYREGIVRALTLTAQLQIAQGQLSGALASLQAATDTVEKYVLEVDANQAGAERIRAKYQRAYQLLTQLQISQGQTDKAWQTLSRQQQLEAAQQNQQSLRNNQQTREVQRVRGESAALEQQVSLERSLGRDSQATEELLAKNKGEYQRVVADLRTSHPQYEAAMAVRPVEFLELKKSIPADTTAVLYFLGEDGLYIFVASRDNDLKIHKVAVTAKELQQCVLHTRQLITHYPMDPAFAGHPEGFNWNDPGSPGYQRHTLPLKQELSRLQHWLIEPIEADLQQRPVLALVPSGILHYVPYAALCKLDARGNPQFLGQERQCVSLVKTSDLIPQAGQVKGHLLYALGNPDGSLPGAEQEVKSIVKSFPKSHQFLGAEATSARLRKLDPDTGYVHLATHGELSGSDPKNSYLVMAGKGEEAKFRATDIYDLDWQGVRLVTLSACKTAMQEGNPGAAITNLAEAFRVAGGQSVVASLWSVADEPTEKLMVEFYQGLSQGKSLAAALQQAENNIAKQPALSHPYYWAAFTLFGDWR